ncbi:DUF2061 domain-containing protein [Azospirillum halopraeferens]|uniref:DUF2061 domain-containing protein n=1 Tax=Azospirillum halopraeferens TaxID=34010 RepID=UPI0003FCE0C9|nr:DUF2061 domain-containing protein [Azospirillum halopraeferens]
MPRPTAAHLLAACTAAALLAAAPARAEPNPEPPPAAVAEPKAAFSLSGLEEWERILYKTASYQTLSVLNDLAIVAALSGSMAAGGVLAATTALTEPVLYYAHESVWAGIAQETGQSNAELLPYKSATYATANMGRVFVAGMLVMNNPALAAGYVALGAISDTLTYAANETVWNYLTLEEEEPFSITSLLPQTLIP